MAAGNVVLQSADVKGALCFLSLSRLSSGTADGFRSSIEKRGKGGVSKLAAE